MPRMKRRTAVKPTPSTPKPVGRMKRKSAKPAMAAATTSSSGTGVYRNKNRRAQASSTQTGSVKTAAGSYPVYKKKSAAASSFRSAFADAKKAGRKTFTWEGKKYNTKTK